MATVVLVSLLIGAVAVHWYFHTRLKRTPSRFERGLATTWLVVRRIFCAIGVLFGLSGIILFGSRLFAVGVSAQAIGGIIFFGFLTWLFAHFFAYGGGYSEYRFAEDRPIHEMRKKRYDWRW